ncbi:type II toxin-antitoxin system HicB family antitoxin [Pseudanabaena sp. 'Roaring Creek']|uniref:type II toxin-antitoxin system HicB family antitoxin n=1 Tax=Pseudanabaena sp. 'Roaring Creek' TaxID=1681830 RepID=UPI0006D7C2B0|nr:type II toxin-antitoxin system HicB family antitoxin [Pseudanabaena sp. 'Roaring Creek']
MKRRFHLIRKKLPDGGYLTTIPELPGCLIFARSLTQEEKGLTQAIAAYLALAKKTGIQLPKEEIYTMSLITIDVND